MQAQRRIYDHAPPTIPIPAEFLDASIEVLFLRLNEVDSIQRMPASGVSARMKEILSAEPAQLSALSLDTTRFKFDRDEANAR